MLTAVALGFVLVQAESGGPALPSLLGPILSTGVVGVVLLMIIFRIKLIPSYVLDDSRKTWDTERERLITENVELKEGLKEAHLVYTQQVIPTLTRVLDAERELVDLRREEAMERRRRGEQ